jgi:hypothetical protein
MKKIEKKKMIGLAVHVWGGQSPASHCGDPGSLASPCEVFGGQSGTGTGFAASASVFPVSVHPSMLRTQLLACYRHCVIVTNEHTSKYSSSPHCIHFYSRNIWMWILTLVNVPTVHNLRNAMQVGGRLS